MADDPQQPPEEPGTQGERDGGDEEPPATGELPPGDAAGRARDDPTRINLPHGDVPPGDATRDDATRDDATRISETHGGAPQGDATRIDGQRQDGAADRTQPVPPRTPAWSGRAGVPVRGPAPTGPPPAGWGYGEEVDDRRWWMPILVGTVALILLGILVVAGWVIVDSARRDTPTPPSPAVTSPVAPTRPTTPPPTTPPPTTAVATPSATATAAGPVVLPPLVGLPVGEAVEALERLGLVPRIQTQVSSRPPGTVLDTDPSTGTEIEPGGEVTLVVAAPPVAPTGTSGLPGPIQPTPGG
ncbi:PASTA domain-containing protein [Plantactinospora sp. WMMC1484]|uniref:Stk1 family PASTA domain-containing Ser/Thr kinase n=1 Tax=Plantactinospora sp. WMMC1484 TaxID=3404122 RepID=UPI003BF5A2C6